MFHKHKWIKTETAYAPPYTPMWVSASEHLLERATMGITTIIWECSMCGRIRKEEMLGKLKE